MPHSFGPKLAVIGCIFIANACAQTPSAHPKLVQRPATSAQRAPDTPLVEEEADWLPHYAAMVDREAAAREHESRGDFIAAAAAWEQAAAHSQQVPGPVGAWLLVRSARAAMKANAEARALDALQRAARGGFWFAIAVAEDPAFAPLRGTDAFKQVVARMTTNAAAHRKAHSSVDDANLIFTDIERFWRAYDRAKDVEGEKERAAIFRSDYLGQGSVGLVDYHHLKTQSIERLSKTVFGLEPFYVAIRQQTLAAKAQGPKIREGLRRLKALYPAGPISDVTFVIGRLNSGGTAGPSGMLIGLEFFASDASTPMDNINVGMQGVLKAMTIETLPLVVVHEHIHTLQQYADGDTLLRAVLKEGSADYLAALALPDVERPPHYTWGLAHEKAVWDRFVTEMDGTNIDNWIANISTSTEDWPSDLGYFVGARICEHYVAQADDRTKAIEDLLLVTDPRAILEKSGYAKRFKSPVGQRR